MGRLTEQLVREVALNKLKEYYIEKYKLNDDKIYIKKEAKVYYKGKNGRADGLLAFKLQDSVIYTASLEAKSQKTFGSLKKRYDDNRFLNVLSVLIIISFHLSLFLLRNQGNLMHWGLSIAISLGVGFIYFIFVAINDNFAYTGAVDQVLNYPANERWIAIPKDTYNCYNKQKENKMFSHAKKHNIGIMVISPNRNVEFVVKVENNNHKNKANYKYLKYYKDAKIIEVCLSQQFENCQQ